MRLAKSVKVILGIVASSGAALVLSGSAFASDAGMSTTSETVSKTTSQNIVGASVQVKTSDAAADSSVKLQDTKTVPGATSGQVAETATASHQVGDAAAKTLDSLPDAAAKASAGADTAVLVNSATTKAVSTAVGHIDGAANEGGVTRNSVVPSSPVAQAGPSSQVIAPAPDVVFHSTMLPVQPKITNSRPLSAGDLAALVPSAPAQQQNPAKVPTPSQPSGLLTRLTSELAGVVVPHAFSSDAAGVSATAQLLILLASVLLLVGLTSVTFGALVRRGGYAHAARSDVADNLGSFFATPVYLSYVPALMPSHNSFLMVSETKILS